MSKHVCLTPALVALRGNVSAYDEDGHKAKLRFREYTASGTKIFGIGQPKRNLVTHPYSADEKAAKSAFKTAAKTRVQIASNDAAWNAWYSAFKAAKTAGTTKCVTLNGFMQANIIKGNIAEGTLMPNIPA